VVAAVVVAVVMVTATAPPRKGSFKQQHELDKNNCRCPSRVNFSDRIFSQHVHKRIGVTVVWWLLAAAVVVAAVKVAAAPYSSSSGDNRRLMGRWQGRMWVCRRSND
jgi:hypothetical protein